MPRFLKYPTWTIILFLAITSAGLSVSLRVGHAGADKPRPSANRRPPHSPNANAFTDLAVTNSATANPVNVGGTLNYAVTVKNNGPDIATGVVLTDALPQTVTFVSALPTPGSCQETNHLVTCTLGALGPGATVHIAITVTPLMAGIISATATVSGNEIDTQGTNNSVIEQTSITGAAANPSVLNSTIFNPPGIANNLGPGFGVGIVEDTGLVYIGTTTGNEVGVIDSGSNTLTSVIAVPTSGSLHFSCVNQPQEIVYFLQQGSVTNIVSIDGRSGSPTFNKAFPSITLAGQTINSFAVDETHNRLYVSSVLTTNSNSSKVSIIDANPASATFNQVLNEVALPAGASIGAVAVNETTNKIYCAAAGSAPGVYVIDGVSLTPSLIASTVLSRAIIVNATANLIYAAFGTQLNAIDGTNNTLLTTINLPSPVVGTNESMVVNRTTGRVALRGANQVIIVDGLRGSPSFNTVVAQPTVTDLTGDIAFDELSNRIVVIAQNSLNTTIISGASNTVVATIPSTQFPSGMAFDHETRRAFVANQFDYVQKIDVAGGTLEASIATATEVYPGVVSTATHNFYFGLETTEADAGFMDRNGIVSPIPTLPHVSGRYAFYATNNVTNRLYVENSGANLAGDRFALPGFVSVIDGNTNNLIANVQVGNQPFTPPVVNQTTNKIYLLNAGLGAGFPGSISVIDGVSNTKTDADVSAFPANTQFFGRMVGCESANKVYFSTGTGFGVLNGATNVASPLSFTGVVSLRVNNALGRLYVLYTDGTGAHLAVVNCSTDATVTTLNFGPVGTAPLGMVQNETTARVFLTVNDNIIVVNGNNNGVDATFGAGGQSVLAVNEQANHIYLGNTASRSFAIMDGTSLAVKTTLALPFVPQQAFVDPKAARVFVVSGGSSDLSGVAVIEDSTHTISGRVTDPNGNPLVGLAVLLGGGLPGGLAETDGNGGYSFSDLAEGGNYTVTPGSGGISFSPASQTFNNLTGDRIANFVGTRTVVSISGKVTDANNVGLNNVTVNLTRNGLAAGNVQTDSNGDYSFPGLSSGADYIVKPAGSFSPSSQSLGNLTINATADFKAAPIQAPQCNAAVFGTVNSFPAGNTPAGFAVADFNGDGKVDLVVANQNSNNVSLLLGTGTGSFGSPANFSAGSQPVAVGTGDFNSDGRPDLVVTNFGSNNVTVLMNDGGGSFAGSTNYPTGTGAESVAIGDFNGDGKLDLAVANQNSQNVSVLLGNGGPFSPATNFTVGTSPVAIATGDFNNDGKLDLATANVASNNVTILIGTGTGSFGGPTAFAAGSSPPSLVLADFNGDGKLDVITANRDSQNVSLLLGNGAGGLAAPTNFPVGADPQAVATGDFNGDGKLDLATANANPSNFSVLLGTSTGGFSTATSFVVGPSPRFLALGDFNGDGKLDAAASTASVSVLLNTGAVCNTQASLTISGRIANAQNASLSDVAVTLSGPVSRVVASDSSGNYSFANLIPGGNYAVTVQSNYFVFGPSRVDYFNLSSNQTANFMAAPFVVPSPTPPPSDNFDSTTRDTAKWTIGTQTEPPNAFDPQVTTAQINGQLVITPQSQVVGNHYNGYVSANSFDLRNGKVSVELVKAATGGADTIFAIGSDSDNFYRFMVHSAGGPTSLAPTAKGRDGIERPLDTTTTQLLFQVKINGVITSLSIPYDPVQHRFMRFRHDPLINSILFETSPDNVNFTVQQTIVLQKGVSALTAELTAGTSTPSNPGVAVFDNFSLVTSTFQFSAGSYTVNEADGSFTVTVTRSGDITKTGTVDFSTSDGTARQKLKYINAAGTLTFASGETSKTFRVLIEDNVIAEGEQALNLLLSNPTGAGLNTPGRSVLKIEDNDNAAPTGNPLDDPVFFVKQHYFDFLNRAADSGGLTFWTGEITQCNGNQQCERNKRIDVSNAFFYEQEFQQTGAYVVRLYRIAYGNNQPFPNPNTDVNFPNEEKKLPLYLNFATDRARVKGGAEQPQTQLDLANAFVQRAEFTARYPQSLATADQFVDALLATVQTDLGVNLSGQKPGLITLYNSGGRGAVLYRLADDNVATNPINNQALIDAEYNRAFVYTQYAGYLRRNADIFGFQFWLTQVNRFAIRDGNAQHAMVCSFITSAEYQQRFSPVVTHANGECPQ